MADNTVNTEAPKPPGSLLGNLGKQIKNAIKEPLKPYMVGGGLGPIVRFKAPKPEEGMKKTDEELLSEAKTLQQRLGKRYNVKPYLVGSMATGLSVPGSSDFDFGVNVLSRDKFDKLVKRLHATMTPSKYNKPGMDKYIFTTEVNGVPVDLAVTFGKKGIEHRKATQDIPKKLSEEAKQKIVANKQRLKESFFLPEYRYKLYKKKLDQKLGYTGTRREPLDKAAAANLEREIKRKDVYGHRTSDIEPIIQHGLLSAAEAGKRGLLKSYESTPGTRERTTEIPTNLRSDVFFTKGLLPTEGTYGKYGIMFRKRKVEPATNLSMIPEEYVAPRKIKSKLTFIVPDEELDTWRSKYPKVPFVSESNVPEGKRLDSRSITALFKKIISIPRPSRTEEVKLPVEKTATLHPFLAYLLGGTLGGANILKGTAYGFGLYNAADSLRKDEAAGRPKDYGEAFEKAIEGGIGGTLGAAAGTLAGLATVPILKGKGMPVGVAMIAAPYLGGKVGGALGMRMLSSGKEGPILIPDKSRFDMIAPKQRLAYVKGKGVVKLSQAEESRWKKYLPYAAGVGIAGLGLAGGFGATRLLKKALQRDELTKPELAAILGGTLPVALGTGHYAGKTARKWLDERKNRQQQMAPVQ